MHLGSANYPFNSSLMGIRLMAAPVCAAGKRSWKPGVLPVGAKHIEGLRSESGTGRGAPQTQDRVRLDGHCVSHW